LSRSAVFEFVNFVQQLLQPLLVLITLVLPHAHLLLFLYLLTLFLRLFAFREGEALLLLPLEPFALGTAMGQLKRSEVEVRHGREEIELLMVIDGANF
jgi:hypothetical protein